MPEILLYHGACCTLRSPDNFAPYGISYDFGPGYYCTDSEELAREWAVDDGRDGYVNRYSLDTDGLKVLDLRAKEYSLLHWASLVCANRDLGEDARDGIASRRYLLEHFPVCTDGYDIIIGSPADDCCLVFLMDFVRNSLSVQGLAKALRIDGRTQIVLKSKDAYSRVQFLGSERVPPRKYFHNRRMRCSVVNRKYECTVGYEKDDIVMAYLIGGKVSPDDPALWVK